MEKSVSDAVAMKSAISQVTVQGQSLLTAVETDPAWKYFQRLSDELEAARDGLKAGMSSFASKVMSTDTKEWRKGYSDADLVKECAIFVETWGPKVSMAWIASASMLGMKKARVSS